MSFVSYAQNFEDVMLWRALKHVDHGFYIDIGAQDPVIDSVSLAFYEHGWRGIHVEPTRQYSTKLREARPDEIVEQVAIGNSVGLLKFYEFENTGLSTADPAIALRHQEEGYAAIITEVPIVSMDVLFDRYRDRVVYWLKLDVEGFERSALESWRTSTVRPWVLVIESTKPGTQEQTHSEWEALVLDKNYSFAYFDGLNRFYVHCDHSDLLPFFDMPPNIFDGFVLSGTASQPFYRLVSDKAQQAEVKAQQAEAKVAEVETALVATTKELHDTHQASNLHWQLAEARHQQIQALLNSTSWRVTAPLRSASSALRSLTPNALKPRAKALLQHAVLCVGKRPRLKNAALNALNRFPRLKSRLFRIVSGTTVPPSQLENVPTEIAHLTPRARQIYADIKAAIERRKKEVG
jgi:FkbM family methyltransferase